jgi:hypothetical protein
LTVEGLSASVAVVLSAVWQCGCVQWWEMVVPSVFHDVGHPGVSEQGGLLLNEYFPQPEFELGSNGNER